MKDEKKYADIVDVVDQLETCLHEAYSCEPADDTSNDPPTLRPTSRPDQPSSHVPPVADDSDPLASVKVPCFGDQLTRVRFAGASDLRAGNKSARNRLDHIYPLRIAGTHRGAGKSIIGVGSYSYIHVLHHLFPLKAIVFTVCEHEYMNICPQLLTFRHPWAHKKKFS